MASAQAGDRSADQALLRACTPFIKRVARHQGVHPDRIDDVVQETLLAIHGARLMIIRAADSRPGSGQLHNGVPLMAYGAPAARQRAKFMPRSPMKIIPIASAGPEATAFARDRTALLDAAIVALPARQRDAVEHLALRGHSIADAAVVAKRTEGSLRVNWHRAIKSLRAHIGEED